MWKEWRVVLLFYYSMVSHSTLFRILKNIYLFSVATFTSPFSIYSQNIITEHFTKTNQLPKDFRFDAECTVRQKAV
jgi:hypothetical protein